MDDREIVAELSRELGPITANAIRTQMPSTPPKALFHYTRPEAFLKIMENKSLRASHIRFMNDSSEYIHPTRLALSALANYHPSATAPSESLLYDRIVENLNAGLNLEAAHHIFLASLSECENDLSQWRAYGGPEGGMCLGFDWAAVRDLFTSAGRYIVPCIYDSTIQQKIAADVIAAAFRAYARILTKYAPPNHADFAARYAFLFFREATLLASMTKHSGFVAEKEWRILEFMTPDKLSLVKFDGKPNHVAPAVYFDLSHHHAYEERLPLVSVWIGPGRMNVHSVVATKALLDQQGYMGVDVRDSEIPFRVVS